MTETGNHSGRMRTGVDRQATAASTSADSEDHHIPDPDYGIDPKVTSPMYGSTGRGSEDTVAQASGNQAPIEGNTLASTADDSTTRGTARAGDMTSTANTFDNTQHGLGESGIRGNMDTGVNRPSASSADTDTRSSRNRDSRRDGMVDATDEATFEEGMQHAEGPRA